VRLQVEAPLSEPVVIVVGVWLRAQGADPFKRKPDVGEPGTAGRGLDEDLVSVGPVLLG
jgi:hypothetical protein